MELSGGSGKLWGFRSGRRSKVNRRRTLMENGLDSMWEILAYNAQTIFLGLGLFVSGMVLGQVLRWWATRGNNNSPAR